MNSWFKTLIILTPLIISIIFFIIGKQSAKNEEDKKVKDNLIITAWVFVTPYLLVGIFIFLKKYFIKDNNSTSTQSNGSPIQNPNILAEVKEFRNNFKM